MTEGEAKVLETDTLISRSQIGQTVKVESSQEPENNSLIEKKLIRHENENRFARLKKSLRKRAASIL